MKRIFICIPTFLILLSCSEIKDFQTSKGTVAPSEGRESLLYALPLTTFEITIEATKTITKKGIYSEYAQKLLNISNVPMWDSENWTVTNVNIASEQEADPLEYYTITYQTYPYNIDKLFDFSKNGIILDFANGWKKSITKDLPSVISNKATDPLILNEPIKEKVDTFYRTIMTDSSFVRIPVLKKQIESKTTEDAAKEIAKQIMKIRKSKIKLLRGEVEDYQPDGDALEYSINELNKLEDIYLAFFIGIHKTEKKEFKFLYTPTKDNLKGTISFFSSDKGFNATKTNGCKTISYDLEPEQNIPTSILPDKTKNMLYFRIPIMSTLKIKLDEQIISLQRFPVYQMGSVQGFLFKP